MRFISKLASFAGIALTAGLFMTGTAHAATVSCTGYNPLTQQAIPAGCTPAPRGGSNDGNGYGSQGSDQGNHNGYGDLQQGSHNGGNCGCNSQPPVIKFPKPVTPDPKCHYIGADVKSFQPWGNDKCYTPKPDPKPVYRDNYRQDGWGCQWQDQGNGWHLTGLDSQGRHDSRSHGSDGYGCNQSDHGHLVYCGCTDKTIEFYFSKTEGTWLYEITDVTLHDGQQLTYDGQTWTVEDWTTTGHGAQGIGTYFTLNRDGHTLWGGHEQIGVAHTICHPTYKYVA